MLSIRILTKFNWIRYSANRACCSRYSCDLYLYIAIQWEHNSEKGQKKSKCLLRSRILFLCAHYITIRSFATRRCYRSYRDRHSPFARNLQAAFWLSCAHYIICPALLFHASEVSKKLLSDYEVVILYHNNTQTALLKNYITLVFN